MEFGRKTGREIKIIKNGFGKRCRRVYWNFIERMEVQEGTG